MVECLERCQLKLRRQAEPLKPVDQVVGEQEQMEVGLVGEEVASGNAAQGVIVFELLNQELDVSAVVVKPPEVQRSQWQVRNQDLVVIRAQLEQRELGRRFLDLGSADHLEAIRPRPLGRLIPKLGDLDPAVGTGVLGMWECAFGRSRQASNDHEARAPGFQPLDQLMVVKLFVGVENRQSDPSRPLCETCREQVERPTGSRGIAKAQLSMPEVLGSAFEA